MEEEVSAVDSDISPFWSSCSGEISAEHRPPASTENRDAEVTQSSSISLNHTVEHAFRDYSATILNY